MAVDKVEALVDALARLMQANNPDSLAYKLRNPLLLKSFAKPGRHDVTPDGVRVFNSFLAGYRAAIFDVALKASGLSRAGLKPTDTLKNLFGCYGFHEKAALDNMVAFLRRALDDQTISVSTPLSSFVKPAHRTES